MAIRENRIATSELDKQTMLILSNKIERNELFLNQKIDRENNVKGSVGVLLYCINEKGVFILLGKERKGKSGSDTWCELGGGVEEGETFLDAAIREVREESGGIYQLEERDIRTNSIPHYNKKIKDNGEIRDEMYILLKAPGYYTVGELLQAVGLKHNPYNYKEKEDFKWVELLSLLACYEKGNPCTVQDIDGQQCFIHLRNFFYDILHYSAFRDKLMTICSGNDTSSFLGILSK